MTTLAECQNRVNEWIRKHAEGYWAPHSIITHMTSELGELAKEVNHFYGPLPKKPTENTTFDRGVAFETECGDILFSIICFLNSQGLSLEAAFEMAMSKCHHRDRHRFKKADPK